MTRFGTIFCTPLEEVIQVALDQICAYTSWPVGHAYFVTEDPVTMLPTVSIIVTSGRMDERDAEEFRSLGGARSSANLSLSKSWCRC